MIAQCAIELFTAGSQRVTLRQINQRAHCLPITCCRTALCQSIISFVVTDQDGRVRAYYAMAAGAACHEAPPPRFSPDTPLPLLLFATSGPSYRAVL